MPGMDGFEVLQNIRHDKSLKHIPISVVTHSLLESDIAASYEGGANCVLHKALDIDQFGKK
jgi:CheY-like chemotaxis protein